MTVKELIIKKIEKVTGNQVTDLDRSIELDALELCELVIDLEQTFDLILTDDETDSWKKWSDIVQAVEEELG